MLLQQVAMGSNAHKSNKTSSTGKKFHAAHDKHRSHNSDPHHHGNQHVISSHHPSNISGGIETPASPTNKLHSGLISTPCATIREHETWQSDSRQSSNIRFSGNRLLSGRVGLDHISRLVTIWVKIIVG